MPLHKHINKILILLIFFHTM